MYTQKYIEKLDMAIDELVRSESKGLTKAEHDLHVLLENRKHIERWKEMQSGTHKEMMDGNPRTSYF